MSRSRRPRHKRRSRDREPSSGPTTRVFLGFAVPGSFLGPLEELSQALKEEADAIGLRARWAGQAEWHLTMRFFGQMSDEDIALIDQVVTEVVEDYRPISMSLGRVGAFSSWRRPRVLWAGLYGDEALLQQLFHALDDAFDQAGLGRHDQSSFRPHITLARVKDAPREGCEEALAQEPDAATGLLTKLSLYKSETIPGGPQYTPLYTWELGTSEEDV